MNCSFTHGASDRPYNDYPAAVMAKMEEVFEIVRQNMSETGLKAQHYYNVKSFEEGDHMLVYFSSTV
jgi:hypothetical protein